MKFDERRLCRLDGLQPTARERWVAFYRLWRIAQGHGGFQDLAAAECFRVIFDNWEPIRLFEASVRVDSRVHWPKFIRKKMLENDKRRRLYAGHYEWMDRDKIVARKMHEQGTEVTPTEVAEVRRKVINLVRGKAAAMNLRVPQDDDDLLRWLKEAKDKEA